MIIVDYLGAAAVILFIWSAVLVWASCQLRGAARELEAERHAMLRWKRLKATFDSQQHKWQ